jgi:hypothetical protein
MKSSYIFNALLASSVPAFAYVAVHPKYSHEAELLEIREPTKEIGVLHRARDFSYPPLERRDDGAFKLGTFDLGVKITNDALFAV